MGKGIKLRVLKGTVLPPKLVAELAKLFPDYKQEEYIQAPNYKRSYEHRAQSIYNAFLFLLEAYPLDPKFTPLTKATLKAYADECLAARDFKKGTVPDLQKELNKFTALIVQTVANAWKWSDNPEIGKEELHEAAKCLNRAECYQLMGKGRQDTVTLSTVGAGDKQKYVLQIDETLSPIYPLIIEELTKIKAAKYPKTPAWFDTLKTYQKVYLLNLDPKINTLDKVIADFDELLTVWTEAKKSQRVKEELKLIKEESLVLPSWFEKLKPHHKKMVQTLAHTTTTAATFDSELHQFKTRIAGFKAKKADEVTRFVSSSTLTIQWYTVLSKQEQTFLGYVLENTPKIEDAISFIVSRHRALPLLSNYAKHRFVTIDSATYKVTEPLDERIRFSHPGNRDGLAHSKEVQDRHVDSNLKMAMSRAKPNAPLLIQTLISPDVVLNGIKDFLKKCWLGFLASAIPFLPDYALELLALDGLQRAKNAWVVKTNHPLNAFKYVDYTVAQKKECLEFLAKIKEHIKDNRELKDAVKPLLENYSSALNSGTGSATILDDVARELFIASLEQLITLAVGGSTAGSCVSGKDRKALELMHTDAMILYKSVYGNWPQFTDKPESKERKQFVELFVSLFLTFHQHTLAGENAPGSDAIKTPNQYLPTDISTAIKQALNDKKALRYDDRVATNNEIEKIDKNMMSDLLKQGSSKWRSKLIARQLGEDTCTQLYTALSNVIGQEHLFTVPVYRLGLYQSGTASPTGISEIRNLIKSPALGVKNVLRIENILNIRNERPNGGANRTEATKSVYTHLQKIFQGEVGTLQKCVDDAIGAWTILFEQSKPKKDAGKAVIAAAGAAKPQASPAAPVVEPKPAVSASAAALFGNSKPRVAAKPAVIAPAITCH